MQRRGFLGAILAAGFAPAAIGSGVLMPVRRIIVPAPALLASNSLLTTGQVTSEILRILEGMEFPNAMGLEYRELWSGVIPAIKIRKPRSYLPRGGS